MKIYLAARFSRRHLAHALGVQLQQAGHEIVSRWTLPGEDHVIPKGSSEQAADRERERFAKEDIEDVNACDWMISLMENPRNDGRGGRHVEFGYGLAMGKKMTIIGPKETVFHHLPEVEQFNDTGEFLTAYKI